MVRYEKIWLDINKPANNISVRAKVLLGDNRMAYASRPSGTNTYPKPHTV